MDYAKFYTPPEIADLLIKQLFVDCPKSVIDICCGSCNLLNAAKKRWPNTKLIGVDIKSHFIANVKCIKDDGRNYAIKAKEQFPLVLANPPFDFIKKKGQFPQLYNDSDFCSSRLEIEMLLANLYLLTKGGTLLIIMPSSFLEAISNIKIRNYIVDNYKMKAIYKLPENIFGSSKISSYAITIENSDTTNTVDLYSIEYLNNSFIITRDISLNSDQIISGIWNPNGILNMCKLQMRRGNIASNFFCDDGIPILHTAKKQNPWIPSLRYVKEANHLATYADYGDIIVSRIGKSAGAWYRHIGKRTLISDCLYCIKDPDGRVFKKLNGNYYSYKIKGVATKYITISDFLYWYSSLSFSMIQ